MFQGASALKLDIKGRMSVPTKYRDVLEQEIQHRITLTKHPDGCLLLFPNSAWEVFRDKVAALPMDAHWWRRIFLGNANELEIDGAGRISISVELRMAANIEREVMLLGMGSHFEIWDTGIYFAKEREAMLHGLPEALKQFNF